MFKVEPSALGEYSAADPGNAGLRGAGRRSGTTDEREAL